MPRPEESGLSIDREREVRGMYIGGFPESERAIRGAPEALRVLRGKVLFPRKCGESPTGEELKARLPARARIRLLYCTMVN